MDFHPISKKDMLDRGWVQCDFVYVIGDAYVDHPSFGPAIISRLLEAHGYKVGIISQPDWKEKESGITGCEQARPGNDRSFFSIRSADALVGEHVNRNDWFLCYFL